MVHFPPSAHVVDIPSNRRRDLGKELVPRDFDGSDKTTWRDFKSYFSFIVKRNGWTKTEAGLNLACCMKDEALTVLNELDLCNPDYDRIVAHFNERFEWESSESYWMDRFDNRTMLPQESPSDLAYALRSLCRRAYPLSSTEERERMCLVKFLKGLPSVDMRRMIRVKAPKPPTTREPQPEHTWPMMILTSGKQIDPHLYKPDRAKVPSDRAGRDEGNCYR